MHPEWSPENESSSCTASPDGVTPACSQHSPGSFTSASTMKNAKNCSAETGANDLDPLVSETSTSLELQKIVQPEVRSVSPSSGCTQPSQRHKKVHSASGMSNRLMHSNDRKGPKDQAPVAEEERRKIKRERNKIAAAKCRNRRRDLTDTLQAETEELEENKAALQTEIASLLSEKEKLEEILASRKSTCKQPEDDDDIAYLRHDSLQYLSVIENTQIIEGSTTTESSIVQDIDVPPNISASAIQGNSNILFCPTVKEESMEGLKRLELDDLDPSLEIAVAPDTAPSVPDIDLGGPFCLSDWDTLYKCVANDIGTQVLSSSPESSNFCTAFSFNYSEIDIADNCEGFKEGLVKSEMQKFFLDSPTLLSL